MRGCVQVRDFGNWVRNESSILLFSEIVEEVNDALQIVVRDVSKGCGEQEHWQRVLMGKSCADVCSVDEKDHVSML